MSLEHQRQTQLWFDKWSESPTHKRLSPWLAYVQRHVLSVIDWERISHLLDVGCGSGRAVQWAAEQLKHKDGALACGCDISMGMLKHAFDHQSKIRNAHFLAASSQFLSFKNNTFDVILNTVAFHHFPIPSKALQEFRRVLRPGGRIIIADRCRDLSLMTWIWDRLHRWFVKGHVKYYRIDEILEMLKDVGFDRISVSKLQPRLADTKKISGTVGLFLATNPL